MLLLLLLLELDEPLQLRLVRLLEGLMPVAVRRGGVERRGGRRGAVLLVLELLRGGEVGLHLLREEVGNGRRGGGGGGRGRRGGGGGGEGQLRGSLAAGSATAAGRGVERILPRCGWVVGRGGSRAEERDEDAADERRLGGDVDAELRPELPHHGVRGYPGAALRGGLPDDGLHVVGQLLVGQHRGQGGGGSRSGGGGASPTLSLFGGGGGGGAAPPRPFEN